MTKTLPKVCLCAAMLAIAAPAGCGKTEAGSASSAHGASAAESQAQAAVMAGIQKRWIKNADGWVTARDEGSSFAPIPFVRQIRDITVDSVATDDLDPADRLNGIEWAGEVNFKSSPCREAGDPGIVLSGIANVNVNRPRGRWSQWIDFKPETVHVLKVKGNWQINQDTWLLRGKQPAAADFARAGVK